MAKVYQNVTRHFHIISHLAQHMRTSRSSFVDWNCKWLPSLKNIVNFV